MKKKYNTQFKLGKRIISENSPTYFIADIAANHDGSIFRAKELIWRAKEAGADCAKFQHFLPEKIISDYGFCKMNSKISHQKNWKDSVFKIYEKYHTRRSWPADLIETCKTAIFILYLSETELWVKFVFFFIRPFLQQNDMKHVIYRHFVTHLFFQIV